MPRRAPTRSCTFSARQTGCDPVSVDTQGIQSTGRSPYFRGETLSVADWSKRVGFDSGTVGYRLRRGWSVEEALTIVPEPSNAGIAAKRRAEHAGSGVAR